MLRGAATMKKEQSAFEGFAHESTAPIRNRRHSRTRQDNPRVISALSADKGIFVGLRTFRKIVLQCEESLKALAAVSVGALVMSFANLVSTRPQFTD